MDETGMEGNGRTEQLVFQSNSCVLWLQFRVTGKAYMTMVTSTFSPVNSFSTRDKNRLGKRKRRGERVCVRVCMCCVCVLCVSVCVCMCVRARERECAYAY